MAPKMYLVTRYRGSSRFLSLEAEVVAEIEAQSPSQMPVVKGSLYPSSCLVHAALGVASARTYCSCESGVRTSTAGKVCQVI